MITDYDTLMRKNGELMIAPSSPLSGPHVGTINKSSPAIIKRNATKAPQ